MNKSVLKFVRLSSKKARLIAREIVGMNGEYALASLEFTPNKAANIISKVLNTAISDSGSAPENLIIVSCIVDKGPYHKRFRANARGRGAPIRKPTSHVSVCVADKNSPEAKKLLKNSKVEEVKSNSSKTEPKKTIKKTVKKVEKTESKKTATTTKATKQTTKKEDK